MYYIATRTREPWLVYPTKAFQSNLNHAVAAVKMSKSPFLLGKRLGTRCGKGVLSIETAGFLL